MVLIHNALLLQLKTLNSAVIKYFIGLTLHMMYYVIAEFLCFNNIFFPKITTLNNPSCRIIFIGLTLHTILRNVVAKYPYFNDMEFPKITTLNNPPLKSFFM